MSYATNTSVPVDRSKSEIERTLTRYGAESFGYGVQNGQAIIMFQMKKRAIRFHLPLPALKEFAISDKGRHRKESAMFDAMEQELRRRWRALALVVKAKLESVESGIATFDDEFLAYIVMPGGKTVGDQLKQQIEHAYDSGKAPPLMLEFSR